MPTDSANKAILEQMKPETSDKFFCQNCQIDRNTIDRRDRVLDLKGKKHRVVGCVYCKGKKGLTQ